LSEQVSKKLDYIERREIEKYVEKLSQYKGRHSSLTTLYVPHDKNLVDVINFLRQEYETAGNIKDKTNRKMVQDNIQSLIGELQKIKKLPPNGLAMFIGHATVGEGQFQEVHEVFEPPLPIKQFIYICGKEFYLEPLKEMARPRNIIAVILLEAGHYTLGLIKGKHIEIIKEEDYYVIGKFKKGGQSARRFERLREEQVNNFYKHLAKIINESLLPILNQVDAIVFGGNTIRVQEFLEKELLDYRVRKKIIDKVISVPLVTADGIFQAVKIVSEIIRDSEIAKEKELWEDFKSRLGRGDTQITYGRDEVLQYLKEGRVETVIVSEKMGNLIDEVIELARQTGAKVEIFSADTESGQELLAFGGLVGILRW